ncbi:PAS domain-containing sensor histidine kinase [Novimethylophilus kurashikiensis]|nr:PAS domain S-box protein [Novimethylophilus kurashikiensis]
MMGYVREDGNPALKTSEALLYFIFVATLVVLLLLVGYHIYKTKKWRTELDSARARSTEMGILLSALADNSADVIIAKDMSGRYLVFNHAAENMFGLKASNVIGHFDDEVFPEDLAKQFMASDREVMREGKSIIFEESLHHNAKGAPLTFLTTKTPMRNSDGIVYGVCAIATDITSRKEMEDKLKESERKFYQFFQCSPTSTFISERDNGRYLAVNEAFCHAFGYTEDEILGKTPEELNLWAGGFSFHDIQEGLALNGRLQGLKLIHRRKNGTEFHVAYYGDTLPVNKESYLMGSIVDISEQNRFEEELLKSRKRYLSLFEHMMAAVAYCQAISLEDGSPDLIVLESNNHFETVSGLNPMYITAQKLRDVMPDLYRTNKELFERCASAANSGVSSRFEAWVPSLSRWLEFSVCGLEKGFFVMLFDDITERKRNETEVLRLNDQLNQRVSTQKKRLSDAVGDLETFVYSVSTLLQESLETLVQLLQNMREEDTPPPAKNVGEMMDVASRMERLLEGAVSYLCGTSMPFEPEFLSMSDILAPVVLGLHQRYPKVTFTTKPMPRMIGSALILRTIYNALLDNAVHFASIDNENPIVEIGAEQLEMETVFYVKDNGPGFDTEMHDDMFRPYFNQASAHQGRGIGLALAKRMVERHGGRMWAETIVPGGSVFYFTLGPLEMELPDAEGT